MELTRLLLVALVRLMPSRGIAPGGARRHQSGVQLIGDPLDGESGGALDIDEDARREGIRILEAGFAEQLTELLLASTAPIYWYGLSSTGPGSILANGTMFFVDAGAGLFGVTANHVFEGFCAARESNPNVRCQVGSAPFDPHASVIGVDARRDIATFRITPDQLNQMGKRVHTAPSGWPPKPPEPGKGVFFGGYPGVDRSTTNDGVLWSLARGLEMAYSVSEERITIKFEREKWVCQHLATTPPRGYTWGGISGGPIFTLVQGAVFYWRLGGVITDFGVDYEILLASSLSGINPDGTLC